MKFKKIPKDYFPTILDRLTRFEPACIRYKRVFDDIINKFLISSDKSFSLDDKIKIACEIFNSSLKLTNNDFYINDILQKLENKYFYPNRLSEQYLSSEINISGALNLISDSSLNIKNLIWLKKINDSREEIEILRKKFSLLYPVEKILLCEGLTEFTLLKTVFSLFDFDLDKSGVSVLPCGGKNRVARKYWQMIEYVKIPFFILLDKDALSMKEIFSSKLRNIDRLYILNSGEFEDLIPKEILLKAINSDHPSEINCCQNDFTESSNVHNLELIFKKYGFGEYKKAKFASILNDFIMKNTNKNDFLASEIPSIIKAIKY